MKRFVFRLDSVLRIRVFELERARVQLAALEAECGRRESLVRGEVERLAKGSTLLEAETQTGADGERLAMRADGLASGRYRLARAERSVADMADPITEARSRVHYTLARVRSLERLKEDAEAKHRKEGLAAEQAELEELAMGRVALERHASRRALEADAG